MIKIIFISIYIFSVTLCADTNKTTSHDKNDTNSTKNNIKKQMELEKKYAKEQKFYMGDDYDLKSKEVDKSSLKDIKVPEPEYDFDITYIFEDESDVNKSSK